MTCKLCHKPLHEACSNGHVIIDDMTSAECPNMKLIRIVENFNRRIPPAFQPIKMAKHTPLYIPRSDTDPGADLTNKNLFIRGVSWNPTFISHLKKVFFCKPSLQFQIVTDARIKDVWLGAESYTSRPKGKREEVETNNVISDLVSENFGLVVVHLGQLMHKNSAASNVLREALMFRDNLGLKTWLFQSSDPGSEWFHSRDDEVEAYVQSRFEVVDLAEDPIIVSVLPKQPLELSAHTDFGVDEEPMELPERSFVPRESQGSASDGSLDDLLAGYTSKKTTKKKWRR